MFLFVVIHKILKNTVFMNHNKIHIRFINKDTFKDLKWDIYLFIEKNHSEDRWAECLFQFFSENGNKTRKVGNIFLSKGTAVNDV